MSEDKLQRDVQDVLKGPPTGYFVVVPGHQDEEIVNIAMLPGLLLRSWKILVATTLLAAAVAAGITLFMRNSYRAQALIAPVEQGGTGLRSALQSQLGGFAALTGVDLGTGGGRREVAYATLTSPGFARDYILTEKLMPILYADRWDAAANRWLGGQKPPTVEDAVKMFTTHVRSITEDKKTSLVTVTVDWYSPELAARWANGMVDMVNERLRAQAIHDADQSVEYLNKELSKTAVVELREAIYRLIEEQINNAMVANVEHQYAFRVIDAAVPPESKFSPKRTVMTLVGAVLGLVLGMAAILLRQRFSQSAVSPVTPR